MAGQTHHHLHHIMFLQVSISSGMMAYKGYGDNFLAGMQAGFTKIVNEGKVLKLLF